MTLATIGTALPTTGTSNIAIANNTVTDYSQQPSSDQDKKEQNNENGINNCKDTKVMVTSSPPTPGYPSASSFTSLSPTMTKATIGTALPTTGTSNLAIANDTITEFSQ